MKRLIVDTGAWLLALKGQEPYMNAIGDADEIIVPGLVLAEVDYHLRRQRSDFYRLLADVQRGAYVYAPPTIDDLSRAVVIDMKFKQLELGLVDATIAALAERLQVFRLITTDSDFLPLRLGKRWNRELDLVIKPVQRER